MWLWIPNWPKNIYTVNWVCGLCSKNLLSTTHGVQKSCNHCQSNEDTKKIEHKLQNDLRLETCKTSTLLFFNIEPRVQFETTDFLRNDNSISTQLLENNASKDDDNFPGNGTPFVWWAGTSQSSRPTGHRPFASHPCDRIDWFRVISSGSIEMTSPLPSKRTVPSEMGFACPTNKRQLLDISRSVLHSTVRRRNRWHSS